MSEASERPGAAAPAHPPLWLALLLTAMAGGMGWGIRGQYGHQTGAMVPGLLVALTIVLLFPLGTGSLHGARAVSLAAIGIAFGGSMTYGQTIGLTHDAELRGNTAALAWGMTGLFLKGAIWIGLAGAFLGMGLSTRRYRVREILLLFGVLIGLMFAGMYLLNEPFNPAERRLPAIYFSDDWRWEPDRADLKPRRENWGGLLFALAGVVYYAGVRRKDALARNLALIGALSGGIGFAGGQCLQAYHAWHPEAFREGWIGAIDPHINWWNMMETFFGAVLGAGLGLGVWLNRARLGPKEGEEEPGMGPGTEAALAAVHAAGIGAWQFLDYGQLEDFADLALTMGALPAAAVLGGRRFPYWMAFPIIALPIAGKTLRQMSYRTDQVPLLAGWLLLFLLPMAAACLAAAAAERRSARGESSRAFARAGLLLTAWLYFLLNFVFFEFPWPWSPPTSRTPSAAIFAVCLAGLTAAALRWRPKDEGPPAVPTAAPSHSA